MEQKVFIRNRWAARFIKRNQCCEGTDLCPTSQVPRDPWFFMYERTIALRRGSVSDQ